MALGGARTHQMALGGTSWRRRAPVGAYGCALQVWTADTELCATTCGAVGTRIWMTGESGLQVTLERQGKTFRLATDYVALHDGIQPNNYGMRPDGQPLWRVAGDCSLALGARAAAMHGELVALDIIQQLSAHGAHSSQIKAQEDGLRQAIKKEEKAQKLLREIYQVDEAATLNALSPDTVICRC